MSPGIHSCVAWGVVRKTGFKHTVGQGIWEKCLDRLEAELTAQQFNTWIRPLQAVEETGSIRLFAPNQFVRDWVNEHLLTHLSDVLRRVTGTEASLKVVVGSVAPQPRAPAPPPSSGQGKTVPRGLPKRRRR